jgi:hypothetical protein
MGFRDRANSQFFRDLEDKRSHINKLHSLDSILLVGIASVVCGAQTWKQMEEFAHAKRKSLEKVVEFHNGIPSKCTINRIFSAIDTKAFERYFVNWTRHITEPYMNQVISIDGKTGRGAKTHGKKSPVHIVIAWACENNIVIGQIMVDEKSNEITAIPELLDLLVIEDSMITIDAMGTQTEIAKKITDKGADYVLVSC